ncbi:MAG: hotdog fold thioesterase [Rhodobacterales bacterium]|nr:hotdog fold thioesterase [Rhodobacterales bacterium]
MATDVAAQLHAINLAFFGKVPFNVALGIKVIDLRDSGCKMKLPYRADLVGNPVTGAIHGGVITTLMDTCCGGAVFMSLDKPQGIATLDLRIDYLRSARGENAIFAEATVLRTTRDVSFVKCVAYEDDPDDPLAVGSGAFMIGTAMPGKP